MPRRGGRIAVPERLLPAQPCGGPG
jgi:hypothetical protein